MIPDTKLWDEDNSKTNVKNGENEALESLAFQQGVHNVEMFQFQPRNKSFSQKV